MRCSFPFWPAFPLLTALRKPAVSYLGWEFETAMYLWLAGAILAWILYSLRRKRPPQ